MASGAEGQRPTVGERVINYSEEGVVFFRRNFHLGEKGNGASIDSVGELINMSSKVGSFTCSLSCDYF